DLRKSLRLVGSVTRVEAQRLLVQGRIRYGFGTVRIKALVRPSDERSIITVIALRGGLWSAPAKNCIGRLFETLSNLDTGGYVPSRAGVGLMDMVVHGLASLFVMIPAIVYVLVLAPLWLRQATILLGAVAITYHMVTVIVFDGKESPTQ